MPSLSLSLFFFTPCKQTSRPEKPEQNRNLRRLSPSNLRRLSLSLKSPSSLSLSQISVFSLSLSRSRSSPMELAVHRNRIRTFVRSMYDEGFVNDQFFQLQELKESMKKPNYALQTITLYCHSAKSSMYKMSIQMEEPDVNYSRVASFAREFHATSISIGARNVTNACGAIIQACEMQNKDECNQALNMIKRAYCKLSIRLDTLSEMERNLLDFKCGLEPRNLRINYQFLRQFCNCVISMATTILNELLQGYVQSLINEGIVNNQFTQVLTPKSTEERGSLVQLIDKYCVEMDAILSELRSCIDLPEIDFLWLASQARKLEERSSRIDAEHVKVACRDLVLACDEKNKKNVSRAFVWVKAEFAKTRNKLETFAQMERRIIRLESRRNAKALSDTPGVRGKLEQL